MLLLWIFLHVVAVLAVIWVLVPRFQLYVQSCAVRGMDILAERDLEVPPHAQPAAGFEAHYFHDHWGSVKKDGPDRVFRDCAWRGGRLNCK